MGLLEGKSVIITGGSRGIGRATALLAAREGALVTIASRKIDLLEEVVAQIRKDGGKAIAVQCDVLNEDDIDRVVEAAVKEYGRIDGLANIAQAGMEHHANTIDNVTLEHAMEYFLGGPWADILFMRKVAPYMKEAGGGRIVNVGSHAAIAGAPGQAGYAVAKGGIEALTRIAALHYGKDQILVNVIFPQAVNEDFAKTEYGQSEIARVTAESPIKYLGEASDIAPVIVYLLSEQCHYMTGQFIAVDGGIRFIA